MLPPPTTTATSTPSPAASASSSATMLTTSGLMPNACDPISASPEILSKTRLNAGVRLAMAGATLAQSGVSCWGHAGARDGRDAGGVRRRDGCLGAVRLPTAERPAPGRAVDAAAQRAHLGGG